jgi:hypothetical protein
MVVYKDYSFAVMHVLMTCKEQALYGKIMERFKALVGSDFKPTSLMSDYERAILNTMQTAFPKSRVSGCRFHFSQAGNFNHLIDFYFFSIFICSPLFTLFILNP